MSLFSVLGYNHRNGISHKKRRVKVKAYDIFKNDTSSDMKKSLLITFSTAKGKILLILRLTAENFSHLVVNG